MTDSEDIVNERFEETVSESQKEIIREEYGIDGEIPVEKKRKALILKQSEHESIKLIIQTEAKLEYFEKEIEEDLDHLSEKSADEVLQNIEDSKRQVETCKQLKEIAYEMDWEEILHKFNEGYFQKKDMGLLDEENE